MNRRRKKFRFTMDSVMEPIICSVQLISNLNLIIKSINLGWERDKNLRHVLADLRLKMNETVGTVANWSSRVGYILIEQR